MRNPVRIVVALCLVLLMTSGALAEEMGKKPLKDAPQKVAVRATAVSVEHEGADTAGTRLAFQLKEVCNASSLFALTDADTPKINILISTVPEFASRPDVGSAYAVVWVFAESKGNLQYYLGRQSGVVSEATASAIAQQLAERTDGIAVKYGYLFSR